MFIKIKSFVFFAITILFFSPLAINAASTLQQYAHPHFYVQMENQSDQPATISFQKVVGNVSLEPILNDFTNLSPHQQSQKYGVVFEKLGKNDTFNIVFTGKQDCVFNVAFYGIYNPKITISGPGCFGGGYRVNKDTLELFVSDIHL